MNHLEASLQIRITAYTNAVKAIRALGGNIARVNIMCNGRAIAHITNVDSLTHNRVSNLYANGYWLELEL